MQVIYLFAIFLGLKDLNFEIKTYYVSSHTRIHISNSPKIHYYFFCFRNPNEHHKQEPVLAASRERNRFRSIVWDEYDSVHQKYLEIGKRLVHFVITKYIH